MGEVDSRGMVNEAKVDEIVAKIDSNCDGTLSEEELFKFVRALSGDDDVDDLKELAEFVGKPASELKSMMMEKADDDKVDEIHRKLGCIDGDMVNDLACVKMEFKVDKIVEQIDSNCDGTLSEEELLKFIRVLSGDPDANDLKDMAEFVGKSASEMKGMIMEKSDKDKVNEIYTQFCG